MAASLTPKMGLLSWKMKDGRSWPVAAYTAIAMLYKAVQQGRPRFNPLSIARISENQVINNVVYQDRRSYFRAS